MTPEHLVKFLNRTGTTGRRTLSFLGKNKGVIDALETEVGKEILEFMAVRHEELMAKVLDGGASAEESAERKALQGLIEKFADKINKYYKALEYLKANSE